jgi:hypothetical protein
VKLKKDFPSMLAGIQEIFVIQETKKKKDFP